MMCEQVQDLFHQYVAGTLDLPRRSAVDEHLRGCPRCQAELAASRKTLAAVARLPREIEPPSDLWPAVAERIDRQKVVPVRFGPASRVAWWMKPRMLAAAAVALMVISSAVTFQLTRPQGLPLAPVNPRAISSEFLAVEAQYTRASEEILLALEAGDVRIAPETRAILERNLRVIDAAITESREALARDPANQVLKEMVLSTYEQKLDLLRRVTYPQST